MQRGLPIQMLVKYFTQVGDCWQISAEIRGMVQFRQFNLLHDFSHLGVFDVIFCRNVLIYFDQPTKIDVLDRLARVIEPDGYLLLGAAETVLGITDRFAPIRTAAASIVRARCRPCARRRLRRPLAAPCASRRRRAEQASHVSIGLRIGKANGSAHRSQRAQAAPAMRGPMTGSVCPLSCVAHRLDPQTKTPPFAAGSSLGGEALGRASESRE